MFIFSKQQKAFSTSRRVNRTFLHSFLRHMETRIPRHLTEPNKYLSQLRNNIFNLLKHPPRNHLQRNPCPNNPKLLTRIQQPQTNYLTICLIIRFLTKLSILILSILHHSILHPPPRRSRKSDQLSLKFPKRILDPIIPSRHSP